MYRISEDKEKKIITIELSGSMDRNEVKEKSENLLKIIPQYDKKQVSILALLERLDPIAQDYLPICIEGLYAASEYIDKIALVHNRVVTRMQFERIFNEVNKMSGSTLNTRIFSTKADALKFLS